MTPTWQYAVLFIGSYLFGGIPFGLVVSRLKGIDIRSRGSGNVGATNVGRVLGRRWGILVFMLDVTKGALTTVTASLWLTWGDAGLTTSRPVFSDFILLGTGMCCAIGSIIPVYLRFKGGKGVSTSLGVVLGIYPYLTLSGFAAFAVWAVVVAVSRYISLGSVAAAVALPLAFVGFSRLLNWTMSDHYPLLALCVVMAAAVLVRHRSNIGRLCAGTENKIGGGRSV